MGLGPVLWPEAEEHDLAILGLIRSGQRLPGTARREEIRTDDLLVIEGSAEAMEKFVGAAKLEHLGTAPLHLEISQPHHEHVLAVVRRGNAGAAG